jgi:putative phosphoribosyl transferase
MEINAHTMRFKDRRAAGRGLARALLGYADHEGVIVLGLPRGGVPVAYEVATKLNAPLDVFLVRKLGVPGQEELAMGAIASGGIRVLNRDVVALAGLTDEIIDAVAAREEREMERRERLYRGGRPPLPLAERTVIIIDDGLATGASMRAAVRAVRSWRPARTVVAVPTAPPDTCESLAREADEVVCLLKPYRFGSVGTWYEDFSQTTDEEVQRLLQQAAHLLDPGISSPAPSL